MVHVLHLYRRMWRPMAFSTLVLAACTTHAKPDSVGGPSPDGVATTSSGQVRGAAVDDVLVWRGIPYAAPPVGPLRFAAPVPPPPWTDVHDATDFGQPCLQPAGSGTVGQEDCLTLNVWAPATQTAPLPVLVFVHGGDNFYGSATGRTSDGLYDGEHLAETGAVVVTFDYRLGALGFLAHPALGSPSGNWALRDQLLALHWVHDNIAGFGGDPDRVLLFGQSAGSYDTCALVTSPLAAGLFSEAAMESGPCWIPPPADVQMGIASTLAQVGCANDPDIAACLRSVPAERLASAPVSTSDLAGLHKFFYPVVDSDVLPMRPIDALHAGQFAAVPLMFGTNQDEMATLLDAHVTDSTTYNELVVATFGEDRAFAVEAEYVADMALSYDLALQRMMGDYFFHCRVRRSLRAVAAAHKGPVWRYFYTHTITNGTAEGVPISTFGAGHGLELLVLFRDHPDLWQPTPSELDLSHTMMDAWRGLADTGTVTGAVSNWPSYDPTSDSHLVLDTPISVGSGVRSATCDFWDAHDME
jgi:para-nitrobenzyl esterase